MNPVELDAQLDHEIEMLKRPGMLAWELVLLLSSDELRSLYWRRKLDEYFAQGLVDGPWMPAIALGAPVCPEETDPGTPGTPKAAQGHTARPRFFHDSAGRKATIWRGRAWDALEKVGSEQGYDLFIDSWTRRYFAIERSRRAQPTQRNDHD